MVAMLRSTGYSYYRYQMAFCMTCEEMCFYDVHCVVATAMNMFFSMVPSVIDPNRLSMENLPIEVRLAAMASLTVALKFENEMEAVPSTKAMDTVLYDFESGVRRSRRSAITLIQHYETVVLRHTSVFKCSNENHHRLAICHLHDLCEAEVIKEPRSVCAVRLVTFIVFNTFCEASRMRFTYPPETIGAAVAVAAIACSFCRLCGARALPRLGSREELALARTLLVSIATTHEDSRFHMFVNDGSWLGDAVSVDNLRASARMLMETVL
jgi:hypothetical protein